MGWTMYKEFGKNFNRNSPTIKNDQKGESGSDPGRVGMEGVENEMRD